MTFEIPQRYRYSAYGKTTLEKDNGSTDHSFIESLFAYTGREYDFDTELYGYRSRYFSPEIARFLSQDPLGFASGETNLYRALKNNPLRFVDPYGYLSLSQMVGIVVGGALIGVGVAVIGAVVIGGLIGAVVTGTLAGALGAAAAGIIPAIGAGLLIGGAAGLGAAVGLNSAHASGVTAGGASCPLK